MRLSQPVLDTLTEALREQRRAGRSPIPKLRDAICSAALEARTRDIAPEALLIQLKLLADDVGPIPTLGDVEASALREWIVSACVAAYFPKD